MQKVLSDRQKCKKHYLKDTGCFFHWYPPKKLKYGKPRLGVSRPIYINVDSPNLGVPYFNFLRGYQ